MRPLYAYGIQYAIFDTKTGFFFNNRINGWREEPHLFGRRSDAVQCFNAHVPVPSDLPLSPWHTAVILTMEVKPL